MPASPDSILAQVGNSRKLFMYTWAQLKFPPVCVLKRQVTTILICTKPTSDGCSRRTYRLVFKQVFLVDSGWIMLKLKEWQSVSHATALCALRSDSAILLEELLVWDGACVQEVVEPCMCRITRTVHFSILSLLGGTEPEEAGATQGKFQSIQPASACENKRNYLSTGE